MTVNQLETMKSAVYSVMNQRDRDKSRINDTWDEELFDIISLIDSEIERQSIDCDYCHILNHDGDVTMVGLDLEELEAEMFINATGDNTYIGVDFRHMVSDSHDAYPNWATGSMTLPINYCPKCGREAKYG